MVRVLHIARDEHSFPAGVLYQFLSLLGVIVLAEIGDQYVGTLARVGDRIRTSKPRDRLGRPEMPEAPSAVIVQLASSRSDKNGF
jgi:hypothetical protein